MRTYHGLIKLRKSGNSKVLSVPSELQPRSNVRYKVQTNKLHQLIYTPVDNKKTNLFDTGKWKKFNRRKYLKRIGLGSNTNLVGREKYNA